MKSSFMYHKRIARVAQFTAQCTRKAWRAYMLCFNVCFHVRLSDGWVVARNTLVALVRQASQHRINEIIQLLKYQVKTRYCFRIAHQEKKPSWYSQNYLIELRIELSLRQFIHQFFCVYFKQYYFSAYFKIAKQTMLYMFSINKTLVWSPVSHTDTISCLYFWPPLH